MKIGTVKKLSYFENEAVGHVCSVPRHYATKWQKEL